MEKIIELSLLDRITMPSILTKEGTFEEMIINKDIVDKTKITQEDVKKYSIQTVEKNISWIVKEGDSENIGISFTELEISAIKDGLKKLQEDKKITQDHINLYKSFVKS